MGRRVFFFLGIFVSFFPKNKTRFRKSATLQKYVNVKLQFLKVIHYGIEEGDVANSPTYIYM